MSDPKPYSTLQSLSRDLTTIVEQARPGVVAIQVGRHQLSGFVWRPGLVVTASESLPEDGDVSVQLASGERRGAARVGSDPSTDLALLRVSGLPEPVLPANGIPSAGAFVLAVGNNNGAAVAALGVVATSGPPWRSLRGGHIDARIELDLRMRRVSEGGAVLDAEGGLVGMAIFGPRRRVLVIPAATIDRVAQELAAHGAIRRGYLGIGLHPVELDGGGGGVMAMNIAPGGPADAAGLKQGDILVGWNGTAITGLRGLMDALGPDSIGRLANLTVLRAGVALHVAIAVGARP